MTEEGGEDKCNKTSAETSLWIPKEVLLLQNDRCCFIVLTNEILNPRRIMQSVLTATPFRDTSDTAVRQRDNYRHINIET